MPKLFGIDIKKEVASAFKGQLVPLTLTKPVIGTATVGSLTAGTNDTSTPHTGEGFVEPIGKREPGTLVEGTTAMVNIIAGSLSGSVIPQVNDKVLIDGTDYDLLDVQTDPAGALYECQASA